MLPEMLESAELFKDIAIADFGRMLACINPETTSAKKGEIILLAGDKPQHVGIVLTGQVHIFRDDHDGNRLLFSIAGPGQAFAGALCCAGVSESPVTVMATTDSTFMLLDFLRILHTCPNSCTFHPTLMRNMLRLVVSYNLQLQNQIAIVSLKSVRAKVMRYLESFIPSQGRNITIPFNRENMANFLGVERSALSHELARMKKDGLIEYRKNSFIVKNH